MSLITQDRKRIRGKKLVSYQKYLRLCQQTSIKPLYYFYYGVYKMLSILYCVEIHPSTKIGEGLYIGHPYGITINSNAVLGKNINIHKGVTIGKENRGKRKGCPIIGDCVWIGINSTIVGNIRIGDDVLIASNTLVNCDVPDHSIVFGNPCVVIHKLNATHEYINNIV